MTHKDHHPEPVAGCFGCKVLGLAYDSHQMTRVTAVRSERTGAPIGSTTEHRSGRQDAVARPEALTFKVKRGN